MYLLRGVSCKRMGFIRVADLVGSFIDTVDNQWEYIIMMNDIFDQLKTQPSGRSM